MLESRPRRGWPSLIAGPGEMPTAFVGARGEPATGPYADGGSLEVAFWFWIRVPGGWWSLARSSWMLESRPRRGWPSLIAGPGEMPTAFAYKRQRLFQERVDAQG